MPDLLPVGRKTRIGLLLLVFAGIVFAGYCLWDAGLLQRLHEIVRHTAPVPLFLALFVILPLLGFPISVLFVVAGARLGLVWGLVAMALVIPLHLLSMAGIAKLLHEFLLRLFRRRHIKLPSIPQSGRKLWIALFSLIPGLSYTIKNYLLPLGGANVKELLLVVWPVQIAQSAPLVLMGSSVSTGSLAPLVTGVLLLAVFIALTPRIWHAMQRLKGSNGGNEPQEEQASA